MNCRVGESAVVDDVHAHPNIYFPENPLLILGVTPCVVEKHSVQEVFFVNLVEQIHIHGSLAVAADRRLDFLRPSCKVRTNYVLSSF